MILLRCGISSLVAMMLVSCASSNSVESPVVKRTYRNPIIPDRNLADPHVIRVGDTYYLYQGDKGTGYQVFVSDDLVNWESKGKVFDDPRLGAWAPDVFHNKRGDGKFYLYYTDNVEPPVNGKRPEKQIGVAVSDGPLGPFVDKGALAASAIDAHLFGDDDGSLFLYYVDRTQGFTIVVQPMLDPLTTKGETKNVIWPTEPWEKIGMELTEAPFMVKRGDIYYLMYSGSPAHSVNYAIGYATAKSPLGPFKKFDGNPIAQRTEKIWGPGHHSVVEGPDKKLWMMYHQKRTEKPGFDRFVALDPLWFDDKGVLHTKLSRDSDEPAPRLR